MIVTRFAPSPTGLLHLGHAFAALTAFDLARAGAGRFLVRIDDLDQARARDTFVTALLEDLAWLGLAWETPLRRQSAEAATYTEALDRLTAEGLLYPCFCTRKEIEAEAAAAAEAPHGTLGPVYPGTCRGLNAAERERRTSAGEPYVVRLDNRRALSLVTGPLTFTEEGHGPQGETGVITAESGLHGDVVLARKDMPASYHLAVVVDDALQGVTHVTRGEDLFPVTSLHRLLQALLDLPTPRYHHHRLILDASGRRLAKRDHAATLRSLRESGVTPAEVRRTLGL